MHITIKDFTITVWNQGVHNGWATSSFLFSSWPLSPGSLAVSRPHRHHKSAVYLVAPVNAYQMLGGIDLRRLQSTVSPKRTTMTYKVEADVPLTLHIIILIFNAAAPDPHSTPDVSLFLSVMWPCVGIAADLMTCTHSPYWISHPASAYTPVVLMYFSEWGISLCFHLCLYLSSSYTLLVGLCAI